ncbi:unnamed protein product, partial [Pleuronectes platessa]
HFWSVALPVSDTSCQWHFLSVTPPVSNTSCQSHFLSVALPVSGTSVALPVSGTSGQWHFLSVALPVSGTSCQSHFLSVALLVSDNSCQSHFLLSQELSSPDQSSELKPQSRAVVWQIPRFPGGTQLCAVFKLEVAGLSSASLLEVGPVGLSFELPKVTATGLQIRFLRLSPVQPGPAQRWVRYVTHSDSYTLRM